MLLGPGGYSCQNRTWMYLTNLENLTFSISIFTELATHQYTIFDIKAPNLGPNLVILSVSCSKCTQFLNLGSFVSDETPSPNQISRKSNLKVWELTPGCLDSESSQVVFNLLRISKFYLFRSNFEGYLTFIFLKNLSSIVDPYGIQWIKLVQNFNKINGSQMMNRKPVRIVTIFKSEFSSDALEAFVPSRLLVFRIIDNDDVISKGTLSRFFNYCHWLIHIIILTH